MELITSEIMAIPDRVRDLALAGENHLEAARHRAPMTTDKSD